MINLISDTVTKPTAPMLEAMMAAQVGDDVFNEDPTVNELQTYAAHLLGHEAGLFCPSGTMTNQLAIKTHTQPMDEVICDITSHVYQYENGGYGFNSGLGIQLLHGEGGKLTPDLIVTAKRPNYDWLPNSKLVVLENSINKAGGNTYTLEEMQEIRKACDKAGLLLHLDGARLFNVLVETVDSPQEVGKLFHSVSICLSKGLGAPVGSLLLGPKDFIARARKFRKAMGGGMRQAGYLAAAGLYALKNHMPLLKADNEKAKILGTTLENLAWVTEVKPVKTNIVIFDILPDLNVNKVLEELKGNAVLATAFGPKSIRFVTHLDISKNELEKVQEILTNLNF